VAIVADAVVQNVIAPYAVSWVRDSFNVGQNVGLYSGLLVGSFSFATALSSPFFGWLSDIVVSNKVDSIRNNLLAHPTPNQPKQGRRVLMAGGLFSAGLLTLIGGLSGKYWVSFSMRFLAGLLDASQTVSFAAIGDLTTGKARFVVRGGGVHNCCNFRRIGLLIS
jgi:MFS family permease